MAADFFSEVRAPKARIRLPAGGQASQALALSMGPSRGLATTDAIPCKEYCISDDALNVADSFSCTISNIDGENAGKVFEGQRIEVDESDPDVANGKWSRTFTGRVTEVVYTSDLSGGSLIRIAAMDLGWHLTSCHGQPLYQLLNVKLGQVISGLIDPSWGFATTAGGTPTVTIGNLLNRALKQGRQGVLRQAPHNPLDILPFIQVEPGQTPWDILQTYVKREGFLINVGAQGDLILFQPDYQQDSPYECLHYHGMHSRQRGLNNVSKTPTLRRSLEGIYSTAECWSTVVRPNLAQEAAIANNPNAQYRHTVYAPTNQLAWNRRYAFSDGEAINDAMRKNRAVYAYQMGQFNSWEYSAEVQRHSSGGVRYTSDSMQSIEDDINGPTSGTFYVQRVQRSVTMQHGVNSQLLLRLPGKLDPSLQAQVGGGARKPSQAGSPHP